MNLRTSPLLLGTGASLSACAAKEPPARRCANEQVLQQADAIDGGAAPVLPE